MSLLQTAEGAGEEQRSRLDPSPGHSEVERDSAEAQMGLAWQRAETASQPELCSYGLPWVPDLFWLHSPPNLALPGEAAATENRKAWV